MEVLVVVAALTPDVVLVVDEVDVGVVVLLVDDVEAGGSDVVVVRLVVVVVEVAATVVVVVVLGSVVVEPPSVVVVVDSVVVVIPPSAVVVVVLPGSEVVVLLVVVVVEGLDGGPGTADQVKPLGSLESAVKVTSVFQLSDSVPVAFTQAIPASQVPLVPPAPSRMDKRPLETAGTHSNWFDKVGTTSLEATWRLSIGAPV